MKVRGKVGKQSGGRGDRHRPRKVLACGDWWHVLGRRKVEDPGRKGQRWMETGWAWVTVGVGEAADSHRVTGWTASRWTAGGWHSRWTAQWMDGIASGRHQVDDTRWMAGGQRWTAPGGRHQVDSRWTAQHVDGARWAAHLKALAKPSPPWPSQPSGEISEKSGGQVPECHGSGPRSNSHSSCWGRAA